MERHVFSSYHRIQPKAINRCSHKARKDMSRWFLLEVNKGGTDNQRLNTVNPLASSFLASWKGLLFLTMRKRAAVVRIHVWVIQEQHTGTAQIFQKMFMSASGTSLTTSGFNVLDTHFGLITQPAPIKCIKKWLMVMVASRGDFLLCSIITSPINSLKIGWRHHYRDGRRAKRHISQN